MRSYFFFFFFFKTIYFNIYFKVNIPIRISNVFIYVFDFFIVLSLSLSLWSMFIVKHLNFCCHSSFCLCSSSFHLLDPTVRFASFRGKKPKRNKKAIPVHRSLSLSLSLRIHIYIYNTSIPIHISIFLHYCKTTHVDIDLIRMIGHFSSNFQCL